MNRRLLSLVLLLTPAVAFSQTPDHRGEVVLDQPAYRGERASAPIPPSQHVRNEGGSDGAGLCVISSILANGLYQGVPALSAGKDSELWRAAKRAPGGYYPEKLAALVARTVPGEKYASRVGNGGPEDQELLEQASKAGYPVGVTVNTGSLYGYRPIHHMVSLVHYRRNGWAMLVDNNRPGFYSAMPASEFNRRWPDMGTAWMWLWTRLPTVQQGVELALFLLLIAGLVIFCAEVYRRTQDDAECEQCLQS